MKKVYLFVAAALVLASCVDDKESATVDELRKGKVEQLAAQTELEKAQAEAARILAEAEKLKAANEADKIQADKEVALKQAEIDKMLAEAEVKVKEAQAKVLEAQAARTKEEAALLQIEAERMQAEAAKIQADAEKVKAEMEQIQEATEAKRAQREIELKKLTEEYNQQVAANKLELEKLQLEIESLKAQAEEAEELKLAGYYTKYYAAVSQVNTTLGELYGANKTYAEKESSLNQSVSGHFTSLEEAIQEAKETLAEKEEALAAFTEGIKDAQVSAEAKLKEIEASIQANNSKIDEQNNLMVRGKEEYDGFVKIRNAARDTLSKKEGIVTKLYNDSVYMERMIAGLNDADRNMLWDQAGNRYYTLPHINKQIERFQGHIDQDIVLNTNEAKERLVNGHYTFDFANISVTENIYTNSEGKQAKDTVYGISWRNNNKTYENVKYNNYTELDADLAEYAKIIKKQEELIKQQEAKKAGYEKEYNTLVTKTISEAIDKEAASQKKYADAQAAEAKALEAKTTAEGKKAAAEDKVAEKTAPIAGLTQAKKDADANVDIKKGEIATLKKELAAIADKTTPEAHAKSVQIAAAEDDLKGLEKKVNAAAEALTKAEKELADAKATLDKVNADIKSTTEAYKAAQKATETAQKTWTADQTKLANLRSYAEHLSKYIKDNPGQKSLLSISIENLNNAKNFNNDAESGSNYVAFVELVKAAKTNDGSISWQEYLTEWQGYLKESQEFLATLQSDLEPTKANLAEARKAAETAQAELNKAKEQVKGSAYYKAYGAKEELEAANTVLEQLKVFYMAYVEKDEAGAVEYSEDVIADYNQEIAAAKELVEAAQKDLDDFKALSYEEQLSSLAQGKYESTSAYLAQLKAQIEALQKLVADYQTEADHYKALIDSYFEN